MDSANPPPKGRVGLRVGCEEEEWGWGESCCLSPPPVVPCWHCHALSRSAWERGAKGAFPEIAAHRDGVVTPP